MSHLGVIDIIYSDVFDSFVSEISKYESSVIVTSTEKPRAILFTMGYSFQTNTKLLLTAFKMIYVNCEIA